jgi:hypothetical protein
MQTRKSGNSVATVRNARGPENAAMLNREHGQHDGCTDDEGRVDAQRQPFLDEAKVDERDLPSVDCRIGRIKDRQEITRPKA